MPGLPNWIYPITGWTIATIMLVLLVPIMVVEGMVRWWRRERK